MVSISTWLLTLGILSAIILVDLIIAVLRRHQETSMKEAAIWTVIYVSTAIIFGYFMSNWTSNPDAQKEFFAGWLTEYALSVDNIFVFIIILTHLKVQKERQQLVLLLGIILTLAIRGLLIPLGAALVARFASIFFLFGGV